MSIRIGLNDFKDWIECLQGLDFKRISKTGLNACKDWILKGFQRLH